MALVCPSGPIGSVTVAKNSKNKRILIYSHDSFGLGHLRRCRKIAHSLVARRKAASVLILSGSPIIGSFDFRTRVDFVRIPGVIKLRNGEYSSLSLHMDITEVLEMRAAIIRHTAEAFAPDLLIVDKEPLGLRGEIHHTLRIMKAAGTRLVLGLRDVMDDPESLAQQTSAHLFYLSAYLNSTSMKANSKSFTFVTSCSTPTWRKYGTPADSSATSRGSSPGRSPRSPTISRDAWTTSSS